MVRKPARSKVPAASQKTTPADDASAEAALDGLVALLPANAIDIEILPSDGLIGEARANIPDGVHERGGWRLTVERNRLTRAARL